MSDLTKLIKRKPCPSVPEAKKAERGERAEGVRDALRSGAGDIVAGAKKLGMQKPGLPAALKTAKCPAGAKPRRGK